MNPVVVGFWLGYSLALLWMIPAWCAGKASGMKSRKKDQASEWQYAYLFGVLENMSGAYGRGEGTRNPYRAAESGALENQAKPRIITTMDELEELAEGSVIHGLWIDGIRPSAMVREGTVWYCVSDGDFYYSVEIVLPATVLYQPGEAE